jgi:short/branched chain acyl-CoA dehydrogenase
MGVEIPGEYGGAGASFTSAIVVIEELAKIDPSVSVLCDVHNTLVNSVFREVWNEGTAGQMVTSACDRQVGKLLPQRTCERKRRICSTDQSCERRKPLGYQWVEDVCSQPLFRSPRLIQCVRRWITNSYEAEIFLIFANADFSKGYKGITCFVATKDMGIQIAKKEQKLGIRASSTCTLNFDDLKIPEENIIGGLGQGYKVAIEMLNEGRIGIAGQMIGLAQGAFNKAVPYTYERKQFGQPVGHFQGMQFQIAQAAIEIEAARLLTYNAAREKRKGRIS